MTATETRAMELWDTGHSTRAIARALGVPLHQAKKMVYSLNGAGEHRRHRAAQAKADTAFLAALQLATGGAPA